VAAAGLLAPAALRSRRTAFAPRLAMSIWLALQASWVAAVVLAFLAATAPAGLTWIEPMPGRGLALPAGPWPGGTVAAVAGVLLSAAVVARAAWYLARELTRSRRDWREHAALVAATGRARLAVVAALLFPAAIACLPLIMAACDVTGRP
jgi:hypothetical protein